MEPGQRYCIRQTIDSRMEADHVEHIVSGMTHDVGRELAFSLLNAGPVVVDMKMESGNRADSPVPWAIPCTDIDIVVDLMPVQKQPVYYMHEMEPFAVHRDSKPDPPPSSLVGSLVDDFFDMWDNIPCSVITRTEV